ncbi:MAG: DUF6194 family protein [Candidatus Dormibacteria bacterium]
MDVIAASLPVSTPKPPLRRAARQRSGGATASSATTPERILEGIKNFPFPTIVTRDYSGWDELSDLNGDGVFRLNLGVAKATFR